MSKNEFLIEKYDKLRVDIKMYMREISKFRISDLKAQKMIIFWTMKHVSAIRKLPVFNLLSAYHRVGNKSQTLAPSYKPLLITVE